MYQFLRNHKQAPSIYLTLLVNAVSDITELEVRLKNLKGLAVGQLFMEPFWLMGLNYLMWTVLGYLQGHNKWGLVLHLYGYMSWPNPSREQGRGLGCRNEDTMEHIFASTSCTLFLSSAYTGNVTRKEWGVCWCVCRLGKDWYLIL